MTLRLAPEVATALAEGRPVVALETSIVAQGLPQPHNLRAALDCEAAVRDHGARPATTAVIAGEIRVGLTREEIESLARASGPAVHKVGARELGAAAALGWTGATTVSATVRCAALAGIRCAATGGIGGAHRGLPDDVSADLAEIARSPVAVFCAGAKMILDLPRTLEILETLGVPVIGFGTTFFPAFYATSSGLPLALTVDSPDHAARVLAAGWSAGSGGAVVAIPPPRELPGAEAIVARAVAEAEAAGISGSALTPAILARVADLSQGASLDVNVELVVNNAAVAARTAAALAALD